MSINFCTLTGSTLDTFCGNRRQIIIDRLLDEKYAPPPPVVLGTNNRNVSIDFAKQYPHLVRHSEVEFNDHPSLQFEQPLITVSAELFGQVSMQTVETKPQLEFVTAIDLEIGEATPGIAVNITDIRI